MGFSLEKYFQISGVFADFPFGLGISSFFDFVDFLLWVWASIPTEVCSCFKGGFFSS